LVFSILDLLRISYFSLNLLSINERVNQLNSVRARTNTHEISYRSLLDSKALFFKTVTFFNCPYFKVARQSSFKLFFVQQDERLKLEVLHSAKMEKTKKKDFPKFLYYRLLKMIQLLFEGAKRLLNFRNTKKQRLIARYERRYIPIMFIEPVWLEVV